MLSECFSSSFMYLVENVLEGMNCGGSEVSLNEFCVEQDISCLQLYLITE